MRLKAVGGAFVGEGERVEERESVSSRRKNPTPADRRREIETRISTGAVSLSDASRLDLDDELDSVLDASFVRYRRSWLESTKLDVAVEIARVLDLKLTLLRNYAVDPTSDAKALALGLRAVLAEAGQEKLGLEPAQLSYLRAVLAVYAGDSVSGLTEIERVIDEESVDELVTLRYHAHMIAAHIRHERSEFEVARAHGERAADLATSPNPTAHALAVAGVNSFALGERDRAMRELEDALRYFDEREPMFNTYFFRNTLLLCGLISFERGHEDDAESFCRRAVEQTEPATFDAFEAWSRLGRVLYRQGKITEAAEAFENGVTAYRHIESESFLDVCFWLARACLDLTRIERARSLLLRIVTSDVDYPGKQDARHILAQMPSTIPKG